jgi:hypothetical protein
LRGHQFRFLAEAVSGQTYFTGDYRLDYRFVNLFYSLMRSAGNNDEMTRAQMAKASAELPEKTEKAEKGILEPRIN